MLVDVVETVDVVTVVVVVVVVTVGVDVVRAAELTVDSLVDVDVEALLDEDVTVEPLVDEVVAVDSVVDDDVTVVLVVVAVEVVQVPQRTGHWSRRYAATFTWPGVELAEQSRYTQPAKMHPAGSASPSQYGDVDVDELSLVLVDEVVVSMHVPQRTLHVSRK